MKIKINDANKIDDVLDKVQAKSKVRTLCSAYFSGICQKIENRLILLQVPEYERFGIIAYIGYEYFPNAYFSKGAPIGTLAKLERGRKNWYLVNVWRGDCYGKNRVIFTEKQKKIIIDKIIEKNSTI